MFYIVQFIRPAYCLRGSNVVRGRFGDRGHATMAGGDERHVHRTEFLDRTFVQPKVHASFPPLASLAPQSPPLRGSHPPPAGEDPAKCRGRFLPDRPDLKSGGTAKMV